MQLGLYDFVSTIGVMVVTFVLAGLLGLIFHRGLGRRDVAWVTAVPAVILVVLAIPSISLLYAMDELVDPQVTVPAVRPLYAMDEWVDPQVPVQAVRPLYAMDEWADPQVTVQAVRYDMYTVDELLDAGVTMPVGRERWAWDVEGVALGFASYVEDGRAGCLVGVALMIDGEVYRFYMLFTFS